ncbi:MAG: polyprenyl synthetase family protein [Anaerolineae bacterium]|nr:polyprenyl synthetase family protein [Anaerolineae bacterium]
MSTDLFLDRYLPLIEAGLRDAIGSQEALPGYYGMMQYHMGWLDEFLNPAQAPTGKRLRPVLCLLACEAVGGQIERALDAAVAIELVHNFSLIHDDIEDVSETRRHRTTVWKLWGLDHGVNCGDGMFALAFLQLSGLQDRGVPAELALCAQRVLTETCLALTEGQYLDMSFGTRMDVDLDSYLRMIRHKSAVLIACSTRLGALLGGADAETADWYARFGENLGMAFQVVDDILGIWGAEDETGKSTSTDILNRKKTLPIVYALSNGELAACLADAQETLTEGEVARVVSLLEQSGARAYAERTARDYSERALSCLEQAGEDTVPRRAIRELSLALLGRTS